MTTEEIQARINEKQAAITNLEASHQAFCEQLNRQIALNRVEYYQLQGAVAELKVMLNGHNETPPA